MRPLHLATLSTLLLCGTALAVPVESIPDPRPGSAVVDLTGTLSVADQAAIDRQAERGKAGGELVVVVIDSVDGANPRSYTTRLFNRWRLDSGSRNKGVVLLAALEDRKAEIVVGDGFAAGVASFTDGVMSGTVVPRFKAGDPRGAMVDGARALVDKLLLAPEAPSVDPSVPAAAASPATRPSYAEPRPEPEPAREAPPLAERITRFVGRNSGTVFGGAGAVLFGLFLGVRQVLRNRPRVCITCKIPMIRLDENADNTHLDAGERKEESLGSVDYDIWLCTQCHYTVKERYGAFFTSFSKCSGCGFKTLKTATRTLRSATYDSSGLAEVTEDCQHCAFHRTFTRSIPRKTRSTSSRSSRSSSGGSSRSSSGRSSGRGSSGSW